MSFTALIFTEVLPAKRNYIEISCTEFYPALSVNMEIRWRLSAPARTASVTRPTCTKPILVLKLYTKKSYTEFHDSPIKILVTDARSETDGHTDIFYT